MIIFEYPPGATPLDPEEIDGLKLAHITTRGELDRWEQENIQEAIAWLERRRKSAILDESFISSLHVKMFGNVWKWAGKSRRTEKNIGVAWTRIPVELRQLIADVQFWVDNATYTPDEIAYRFHHRLVAIHVFPNGNGRHSRLITDILLTEVLNSEPFTWGNENLSNANNVREQYITALRLADQNDYSLLHGFVRS